MYRTRILRRCIWWSMTWIKGQRRFAIDKTKLESEEFLSVVNFLITNDKGYMFVKYTVVVVVIWYTLWGHHTNTLYAILQQKQPVTRPWPVFYLLCFWVVLPEVTHNAQYCAHNYCNYATIHIQFCDYFSTVHFYNYN